VQEFIIPYILGALMAQGISTIWFFSGFPIMLFKTLRMIKPEDSVYTQEEWEVWIVGKSNFFGELLTCPVCLSVWIATAVSSSVTLLFEYPVYFIPAAVLSWPFLMFLSFKQLDNE